MLSDRYEDIQQRRKEKLPGKDGALAQYQTGEIDILRILNIEKASLNIKKSTEESIPINIRFY